MDGLIDLAVSEPHFLDHALPVFQALPAERRGTIRIFNGFTGIPGRDATLERARQRGIAFTTGLDKGEDDRAVLTASIGDASRAHRAGRRRVALLEHGSGQSFGGDPEAGESRSYPGGAGRDVVGLFIAPNAHAAGRDAARYPGAKTAIVGCPKLDRLPARVAGDRPVIAVSVHWECAVAPETRSAWGELKPALPWLARRYKVIGHGHPRILEEIEDDYHSFGIEVVHDFRDVLARASVYVNEASSTLFEAAAAGIPVVPFNPSFFRKHIVHGLRFWEAAGVGLQVTARSRHDNRVYDKLVEAIEESLVDPPDLRARREAALDIVYAHRGDAAQRAAAALTAWA